MCRSIYRASNQRLVLCVLRTLYSSYLFTNRKHSNFFHRLNRRDAAYAQELGGCHRPGDVELSLPRLRLGYGGACGTPPGTALFHSKYDIFLDCRFLVILNIHNRINNSSCCCLKPLTFDKEFKTLPMTRSPSRTYTPRRDGASKTH